MGDILDSQGKAGGGAFSLGFSLGVPAFSLLVRYVGLVERVYSVARLVLFPGSGYAVGCRVGIYAGGAGRWKK